MPKRIISVNLLVLCFLLCSSCYREVTIINEHVNNVFEFQVEASTQTEILEARNRQFYIEPVPEMKYGNFSYKLDRFKIRGKSALNFERKSFSLNLDQFIVLPSHGNYHEFEKFKLLALCQDYTYIENRTAHYLLSEIGIWDLHTFYTEVKINNDHQGLYLFVEDPDEYFLVKKDAEVVLRRGYQGTIQKMETNTNDSIAYINRFNSIYRTLVETPHNELYVRLSRIFNIQNYMRKMALDYIIRNGDTTDEIYFWGKRLSNGQIYFDILPWDYDDIFSEQPHEIWRDTNVGKLFGDRIYNTYSDVWKVIGDQLIYSIEDDIEYAISTIPELYQRYLKEVEYVLSVLEPSKIDAIFDTVEREVIPFYAIEAVIEQSKLDDQETSLDDLHANISLKKSLIKERLEQMEVYLTQNKISK